MSRVLSSDGCVRDRELRSLTDNTLIKMDRCVEEHCPLAPTNCHSCLRGVPLLWLPFTPPQKPVAYGCTDWSEMQNCLHLNNLSWWLFTRLRFGGFFLVCEDFGRMFDNSYPACGFFFFKVEISSPTLFPLFMPGSVHSGSAS